MFDCGPPAAPLPSDEVLKTWTDRTLFDKYVEAWQWGDRCDKTLHYNYDALAKQLDARGGEHKPK